MDERRPPGEYVIGVDGGGTKTAAVVVDAQGQICGRGLAPSSNPNDVGLPAAIAALREALTQALASAQKTFADVAAACLCLAGVDRPDDRARVAAAVRAAIYPFPRLLIYNDAAAALAAGTGRLLGIVVIAGTGTIAYGYDAQGRMARAAGWGALLADHGGGFWIGLEGLHAVVRAADGRGPATALSERLLTHLGLRAPEDLIAWTYGEPFEWRRFAALAPIVTEAARAGDAVAAAILRRAGEHLAESALAVVRKLGWEDAHFDLVLAGSVWQAGELVQAPFREAVLAAAPGARLIVPTRSAAEGAALLAWEALRHGRDKPPDHRSAQPGVR